MSPAIQRFLPWMLVMASVAQVDQCCAATYVVTPQDDWFSKLSGDGLAPGDELVFRAGTYSDARRIVLRHRGTASNRIVIRAAQDSRVVFRRPDAKQNSFNLEGCQYLEINGIEITGGAAGIRMSNDSAGRSCHDVRLENLHIHHIGGVAVTCNHEGSHYARMVFRRNHIHHTAGHGEAFYLGANHGKAIFQDSEVSQNYLHHLNGPNISQGDGIEIKQGSFGNRIEDNVIHDTNYPAITVYGTQGHPRNLITGNLIWNTGDHGIQAAADASIRHNSIMTSGGCGVYSREHQGAIPSGLEIEHNRIVTDHHPAIRIIGSQAKNLDLAVIRIKSNRLFGIDGQPAVRVDNDPFVAFDDNAGVGDIQANVSLRRAFHKQWRLAQQTPVVPQVIPGHPAWRSLHPKSVSKALGR